MSAPAARGQRVGNQPACLLHSIPYRETSLVVDLFTREHGRLAAVAKGAKRPRSALRAVLLAFQPLTVGWSGRGELRTLTGAEWVGGTAAPQGRGLLCAFYLNELLLKLLPREDPHPALYDGYLQAIAELAALAPGDEPDETLRRFEWLLLREIGYAPDLAADAAGRPIDVARAYRWQPGEGFRVAEPGAEGAYSGATLQAIAGGRLEAVPARQQAKYLTRSILAHHLDGHPLVTRRILSDLMKR